MSLRLIVLFISLFMATPAALAVPPIQKATLSNGSTVLLMEAHNVPMLSMSLVLPAGSAFDAKGKEGTATMLAGMLTDHTAMHDNIAWADMLDQDAIQLAASASYDTLTLSLTVLKDALNPGLDAFSEVLKQPGWNQQRFTIMKQDTLAAAQKEKEEPGVQAAQAAAETLFGDHPYGHRPAGTMQSLAGLTLNDVKDLFGRQIKPQGAVLAVSGDITLAELLPLLEAKLDGWQGKPAQTLAGIAQPEVTAAKSVDVQMPTSQTMVHMTRLGVARSDAGFFPVFVLNHMLGGGGFGSRLMEEVREKRGLVYGVYSYFSPLAVPGPFVISLQTRADQAEQAETVVRSVLAELAAGKITSAQLKASKENLVGSFAQRMDSNRERVGLISMIGIYGLPLDYLSVWTERVAAVTLDAVRTQASRFLKPESWSRVRVGSKLD
ncbi:zinc protease [Mariprofundus micogutta]|uniref:Zinc protease n=1 Tax=Mariprofundus micogutta TaxID=1921010 RepID=A0A1L8CMR2_9PROT|nr:pitrilysin family protein [Mariprofundus micogutta]GAV20208.1 zinc protease [Mariprofundus micogutta]